MTSNQHVIMEAQVRAILFLPWRRCVSTVLAVGRCLRVRLCVYRKAAVLYRNG